MQPAQIETTAVDGKFPPPGLCGEPREGEQRAGGGGEGNRHEDAGKKGEADDDFDPRESVHYGQGQSIGQHNLVRINRSESLHRRTDFGESGREEKKPEQATQGKNGCTFHQWKWR